MSKKQKAQESKRGIKEKGEGFFTRNNRYNLKITALITAIVLLLAMTGAGVYIMYTTSKIDVDEGIDHYDGESEQDDDDNDANFDLMHAVSDSGSLYERLKSWATNGGDKMYSKNVLNFVLLGIDSKDGTASKGRSDCIMIISINQKDKKITMISLLRDSFSYINVPMASGGYKDYYKKINAAYFYGGPATMVETIENNLKIEIDKFIAVDFKSFTKLIDALGGVKVEVQPYEAAYINRTTKHTISSGKSVKLNGAQALVYTRIRKSDADGDVSRARRQRTLIQAMLTSAKSASNGQLINACNLTFPYVRTNYSQSEVISLITKALTQGWMDYEIQSLTIPMETGDYITGRSATINTEWVWIVDYPKAAQLVQKTLYGKTNIDLSSSQGIDDLISTNPRATITTTSRSNSGSSGYKTTTTTTTTTTTSSDPYQTDPTSSTDENPDQTTDPTTPTGGGNETPGGE